MDHEKVKWYHKTTVKQQDELDCELKGKVRAGHQVFKTLLEMFAKHLITACLRDVWGSVE